MKNFKKIISLFLCLALTVTLLNGSGLTASAITDAELQKRKEQADSDKEKLDLINQYVAELEAKISENKSRINEINNTIEANNIAIEQTKADVEENKFVFSKRLRSIYMSNSESRIKILLGAESFSQFLQLAQLTSSVSSYDKQMMENLAEQIKLLEEKNKENEKLKAEFEKKQTELDKQYEESEQKQREAQEVYKNSSEAYAAGEAEKAAMAARKASTSGTPPHYDQSSDFCWPSYCLGLTAAFMGNDSVHNGRHFGVDIGASRGTEIWSIGDGKVIDRCNSCPHTRYGGCGCGGGYGNFVEIDYGYINGIHYTALFGHATDITVSIGEHVSKGEVVGHVGTTGFSTGPHIHFGLTQNGSWIDAETFYRNSYGMDFIIWY